MYKGEATSSGMIFIPGVMNVSVDSNIIMSINTEL
jgi:hypothetical protein